MLAIWLNFNMKLISTKKKIIFDGDQEELFTHSFNIECPSCTNLFSASPAGLRRISILPNEILNYITPKIKGLKKIALGDDAFYKIDGLSLKYLELACPNCDGKYIGFFGVGEYQPARFMLILTALISLQEELR